MSYYSCSTYNTPSYFRKSLFYCNDHGIAITSVWCNALKLQNISTTTLYMELHYQNSCRSYQIWQARRRKWFGTATTSTFSCFFPFSPSMQQGHANHLIWAMRFMSATFFLLKQFQLWVKHQTSQTVSSYMYKYCATLLIIRDRICINGMFSSSFKVSIHQRRRMHT